MCSKSITEKNPSTVTETLSKNKQLHTVHFGYLENEENSRRIYVKGHYNILGTVVNRYSSC